MADLDGLARVNETLGHAAGDEALRAVAAAFRAVKRSFDSAARVGGEEFALIAPDCDEHGAYMLAERARMDVATASAAAGQRLTISLGIATFPVHGSSAEGLLRAADQALQAAKGLGRDRTVISSAEVSGRGRARAARRRRDTGGAGRAAQHRRGPGRAGTPAARATPSASAGSPS